VVVGCDYDCNWELFNTLFLFSLPPTRAKETDSSSHCLRFYFFRAFSFWSESVHEYAFIYLEVRVWIDVLVSCFSSLLLFSPLPQYPLSPSSAFHTNTVLARYSTVYFPIPCFASTIIRLWYSLPLPFISQESILSFENTKCNNLKTIYLDLSVPQPPTQA